MNYEGNLLFLARLLRDSLAAGGLIYYGKFEIFREKYSGAYQNFLQLGIPNLNESFIYVTCTYYFTFF